MYDKMSMGGGPGAAEVRCMQQKWVQDDHTKLLGDSIGQKEVPCLVGFGCLSGLRHSRFNSESLKQPAACDPERLNWDTEMLPQECLALYSEIDVRDLPNWTWERCQTRQPPAVSFVQFFRICMAHPLVRANPWLEAGSSCCQVSCRRRLTIMIINQQHRQID